MQHKPLPWLEDSSRVVSQWKQLDMFGVQDRHSVKSLSRMERQEKLCCGTLMPDFFTSAEDFFLLQGSRLGPKTQKDKILSLSKTRLWTILFLGPTSRASRLSTKQFPISRKV